MAWWTISHGFFDDFPVESALEKLQVFPIDQCLKKPEDIPSGYD
jgi:hypothetical protein